MRRNVLLGRQIDGQWGMGEGSKKGWEEKRR